jgi:hypothetical protein
MTGRPPVFGSLHLSGGNSILGGIFEATQNLFTRACGRSLSLGATRVTSYNEALSELLKPRQTGARWRRLIPPTATGASQR